MRTMRLVVAAVAGGWVAICPAAAQSVAEVFRQVQHSVAVIRTVQQDLAPDATSGEKVSLGGIGSGVLVDSEGHVLTAAHVVQTAERIEVEFSTGETSEAEVIASAPMTDLALLRLADPPKKAKFSRVGDSDLVAIGDPVLVVGAPLGISHSLSVGHVSGRRRANVLFGGLAAAELLQTDAAINQGNSGGPMFNLQGEVVGIVSSILSRSGGFEGIGFAVASNTARLLLEERPPWSGLDGMLVTGDLAAILNIPQPAALVVQRVAAGSPAARAGLQGGVVRATLDGEEILLGGDVILGVSGIRLSDPDGPARIRKHLAGLTAGSRVTLSLLRAGRPFELMYVVPASP